MAKYAFIEATEKTCPHRFGIRRMCTWSGVSPSGFFTWRNRPPSARAVRRDELTALVTRSFQRSNGTYGYRRVHADLTRRGVEVGPDLVLDIMAAQGLVACQPRPWRVTTVAGPGAGPDDLCRRDFTATHQLLSHLSSSLNTPKSNLKNVKQTSSSYRSALGVTA
jgi:putative transposase